MFDLRPILRVIGILLSILAGFMLIPALIDYIDNSTEWKGFLISAFITVFVGLSLALSNKVAASVLSLRQAFVLTSVSWILMCGFGALPFMFSNNPVSFTDAYFETVSGLTTTGSTILVGLDNMPMGILLWRSLLQLIGGIGIIVIAVAILPMLNIGGMQLFKTESSDKYEKVVARTAHVSFAIGGVYILLIVACTACLVWAGMSLFDAVNHAITALSTGGFSTHDASIAYFNNIKIEIVLIIFMIFGALPFMLYVIALQGNPKALFKDSQVKWFLSIIALSIISCSIWLYFANDMNFGTALRHTSFNFVSIITTTGFASVDYNQWGGFSVIVVLLLTLVGGCTGSTAGGYKVFRCKIAFEASKSQVKRLIHPHAILRPRFNDKTLSDDVISSVMGFTILFLITFIVVSTILSLCGLDFITSVSAALTALSNVGPGLGNVIGPVGNFAPLSDTATWTLSFAMLLGRLEIFTIMVLFVPSFWHD